MLFYTFIVLAVGNTIVYRDQEIDIEAKGSAAELIKTDRKVLLYKICWL